MMLWLDLCFRVILACSHLSYQKTVPVLVPKARCVDRPATQVNWQETVRADNLRGTQTKDTWFWLRMSRTDLPLPICWPRGKKKNKTDCQFWEEHLNLIGVVQLLMKPILVMIFLICLCRYFLLLMLTEGYVIGYKDFLLFIYRRWQFLYQLFTYAGCLVGLSD